MSPEKSPCAKGHRSPVSCGFVAVLPQGVSILDVVDLVEHERVRVAEPMKRVRAAKTPSRS